MRKASKNIDTDTRVRTVTSTVCTFVLLYTRKGIWWYVSVKEENVVVHSQNTSHMTAATQCISVQHNVEQKQSKSKSAYAQ